jgi:hypothetical protein
MKGRDQTTSFRFDQEGPPMKLLSVALRSSVGRLVFGVGLLGATFVVAVPAAAWDVSIGMNSLENGF